MVVTDRLVSVFGWFGGSSEKLETCRRLSEISLSLVFSFFSPFAGILAGAGSCGLKAGRGVVVVSRGVRETRRSPKNSSFPATEFFFYRFLSLFFFFFFPGSLQSSL